jgi:hypothetical protein
MGTAIPCGGTDVIRGLDIAPAGLRDDVCTSLLGAWRRRIDIEYERVCAARFRDLRCCRTGRRGGDGRNHEPAIGHRIARARRERDAISAGTVARLGRPGRIADEHVECADMRNARARQCRSEDAADFAVPDEADPKRRNVVPRSRPRYVVCHDSTLLNVGVHCRLRSAPSDQRSPLDKRLR